MATSPQAQPNGVHPSTPPASDAAPGVTTTAAPAAPAPADPDVPATALSDSGEARRPREARLIHLVLASMGVQNYQERVPLQLLDFAYRYTSSALSDSLRLSQEGYAAAAPDGKATKGKNAGNDAAEGVTVTSLRQAIASRQGHTFAGHLPKEFMLEQAAERNRAVLPRIEQRGYGVQLPEEKYCLTGTGWGFKEEWESDEEEEEETAAPEPNGHPPAAEEDHEMGGVDNEEDDEGEGRMEDVFGEEGGGDATMTQD